MEQGTDRQLVAYLVRTSGPLAGTRHLLGSEVTRIGRSRDNDIVIAGSDAAIVSSQHCEIRRTGEGFRIADLGSTNGTLVNGEKVSEAELHPPCSIRLGPGGPELTLLEDEASELDLNRTMRVPAEPEPPAEQAITAPTKIAQTEERILLEAVARARAARHSGAANQTTVIMRDMLRGALERSRKRWRKALVALAIALVVVGAFAGWKVWELRNQRNGIDQQIRELEGRLSQLGEHSAQAEELIAKLTAVQEAGRALEKNVLYRLGVPGRDTFVEREIKILLAEFGAEVYRVPPEFLAQVSRFLERYQGPDRPHMGRALGRSRPVLERVRAILEQNLLPADLAYMVLVESALDSTQESPAAAAGLWQFTPATARQYGLRVNGGGADERYDLTKSTGAAARYIRDLILDFGAGSSVMLALAAYNVGPARVKGAIREQVRDPIKQRDFWYLYRVRAIPAETREYVPKVIAAMIIGRSPQRFGF